MKEHMFPAGIDNGSIDISAYKKKLVYHVYVFFEGFWIDMVFGAAVGWVTFHGWSQSQELWFDELISNISLE